MLYSSTSLADDYAVVCHKVFYLGLFNGGTRLTLGKLTLFTGSVLQQGIKGLSLKVYCILFHANKLGAVIDRNTSP